MELSILKLFERRELYDRYGRFIKPHTLSSDSLLLFNDIGEYYNTDPEMSVIDWGHFDTWFKVVKHSKFDKDKLEMFSRTIENINKTIIGREANLLLKSLMVRDYANQIAHKALHIVDNDGDVNDIMSLVDEYNVQIGRAAEIEKKFVTVDFDDIIDHVVAGDGMDWRLTELNLACGPIRKGDFIIIAARPDAGKTTMLASEATYMAKQLEKDTHVLWFNNEEAGKKVQYRILQAALGKDSDFIQANRPRIQDLYTAEVGQLDKIKVYDDKRMHVKDIEEALRNYRPGLIIFDQLWKIFGFEKESVSEVDRQTRLFAWARELASNYCPVITVHQADGTAEGELWIEMNQLYGSKTGVQGEADAIITLGRSHAEHMNKTRGLYVPKNKLAGGPKSDETYRNGKFELTIQPEIARFKGEY